VTVSLPGPRPEDLLALSYLTRWHNKPTTRQQTLGEHLAKVALMADQLGHQLGDRYDDEAALETLCWALQHDLPETEHGDIPNPAKRWLDKSLGHPYDDLVATTWWRDRGAAHPSPSLLTQDLVAIADILDASVWFWVFGLERELAIELVFDTFRVCRSRLPILIPAVSEFLAAAGVPATLIGEAAA
jgi:hypothetical protein